jgi:benzil reductase ((S)-benzoin forming)
VNISSGAATKPSAGWTAYAAAKAAVVQLTRTLALELEGSGVTANALNPGHMDTEMQARMRRLSAEDFPRVEEYRALEREDRLVDPRVPARTIAYLVLPSTKRSGEVLNSDDPTLQRDVENALPG